METIFEVKYQAFTICRDMSIEVKQLVSKDFTDPMLIILIKNKNRLFMMNRLQNLNFLTKHYNLLREEIKFT